MDRESIKIAMMAAVSKALNYKEQLSFDGSELYQNALSEQGSKKTRIAAIAAISKALKYLQEHLGATEQEVLQHIADEANAIVNAIEQSD